MAKINLTKENFPLIIFLIIWLCFLALEFLFGDISNTSTGVITLFLIVSMVVTVIWHSKKEDEVKQAIIQKSYGFGFWTIWLFLIFREIFPEYSTSISEFIPLWTIPFVGFLIGYLTLTYKYR